MQIGRNKSANAKNAKKKYASYTGKGGRRQNKGRSKWSKNLSRAFGAGRSLCFQGIKCMTFCQEKAQKCEKKCKKNAKKYSTATKRFKRSQNGRGKKKEYGEGFRKQAFELLCQTSGACKVEYLLQTMTSLTLRKLLAE